MSLPNAFCWTKFGAEAGEVADSICARKEMERQQNDGIFLWGVGNSIGPSLRALLQLCSEPEILFSPMLSAPAQVDVEPKDVVIWRGATGLDGMRYELPRYSLVTSRLPGGRRAGKHYALVCRRDTHIWDGTADKWLDSTHLRNLRTGNLVGSSQVTSVVTYLRDGEPKCQYKVAFRASLVYPYLVSLDSPQLVPTGLRLDQVENSSQASAVQQLLDLRLSVFGPSPNL